MFCVSPFNLITACLLSQASSRLEERLKACRFAITILFAYVRHTESKPIRLRGSPKILMVIYSTFRLIQLDHVISASYAMRNSFERKSFSTENYVTERRWFSEGLSVIRGLLNNLTINDSPYKYVLDRHRIKRK